MKDIMDTFVRIERRARKVRAFHVAAIAFSIGLLPVVISFLIERGGLVFISRGALLALSVLPIAAFLASFLISWGMRMDRRRVLLGVDITPRTQERLSSLYEMYESNRSGPYRERLETLLQDRKLSWKRALPLGHTALLVPAGVALLVALLVTASLLPITQNRYAPTSRQVASSTENSRRPIKATGQSGKSAMQGQIPTSPPGTGATSESGQPQHSLQDVLDKLWSSPSSPGIISSDQQGLDQLILEQRKAAQRLERLISQIQKRLVDGGGSLTPEEKNALSSLAEQIGSDSLSRGLRELADEKNPGEIGKLLQQMQELAKSLQGESREPPAQAMANKGSGSQEIANSNDLAYSVPTQGSQDESGKHDSTGEGATSANNAAPGSQGDRLQGEDEPFGGDQGSGAGTPLTSAPPQFIRREISGSIGESGDFKDFATKGVPVEEAPSDEGNTSVLSVNYDQLRALLSGRVLSPDTKNVVRKYFDEITQGGE